ncbi:MAG: glycosyltransferase family 2 protein [Candidatus Marinimicrobia bacterium]|nr:glycosyltransferase family 2 protein [Candidatus Neomarinimicrobiota bacterium]
MLLTVIIPIYNEVNTCEEILRRVEIIPLDKQMIVIDDGSTDGSTEILQKIKNIKLIQNSKKSGKGAAVQMAIPFINGDYIILQDGDLEYDPDDYKKLLEPLIKGEAEVVFGSRWLGKRNQWTFHYFGNRLITLFSNIINQRWINDMASCYKAIPADIFKSLKLKSNGFGLEAEITAKVFRHGYQVFEIPINYKRRTVSEGKKIRFKDGLVAMWSCLRYRFFD